jgi:hypothetical protein
LERPGTSQEQTLYVKVVRGDHPIAGAEVYAIVTYASLDRRWPETGFETTAENGIASISFPVSDAGAENVVTVDVYAAYDQMVLQGTTAFAPQC